MTVGEREKADAHPEAPCPSHRPTQHRDGKPPWCNTCGHKPFVAKGDAQ